MTDRINLTDINYCEVTRNVDNMLERFKKDKSYVVGLIDNDINELIVNLWTNKSPIFYDNKCLFNMGRTMKRLSLEERIEGNMIINEGVVNFYTCSQCKNMKRLLDFSKDKIGEPFYIECGSSAGEQLVMSETDISKLFIIKESPSSSVSRALQNPYIVSLQKCSAGCNHNSNTCFVKDYKNMDYIGSDPFTNNVLINYYLVSKLEALDIPNILNMHTSYVCSNKGYSLYEYPDIGRIRHLQEYPEYMSHTPRPSPTAKADDKVPISEEVVKGILMQLFATLHALSEFDFSHGGASSRSLLLHKTPSSYLYDGVHVESPVTIKLCDFYHSGITVGNKRLYNKSVIADEELLRKPFTPIIETKNIIPFRFDTINIEENTNKDESNSDVTIYRLKDPNEYIQEALLFMYIKHLGLPIYQSSFDIYGFMISLMTDRSFYVTVMSNESMYLLWRKMWLPEEFEIIQDKVQKLHSSQDPVTRVEKVFRILAGFGLRCDMINYGWDMIKKW